MSGSGLLARQLRHEKFRRQLLREQEEKKEQEERLLQREPSQGAPSEAASSRSRQHLEASSDLPQRRSQSPSQSTKESYKQPPLQRPRYDDSSSSDSDSSDDDLMEVHRQLERRRLEKKRLEKESESRSDSKPSSRPTTTAAVDDHAAPSDKEASDADTELRRRKNKPAGRRKETVRKAAAAPKPPPPQLSEAAEAALWADSDKEEEEETPPSTAPKKKRQRKASAFKPSTSSQPKKRRPRLSDQQPPRSAVLPDEKEKVQEPSNEGLESKPIDVDSKSTRPSLQAVGSENDPIDLASPAVDDSDLDTKQSSLRSVDSDPVSGRRSHAAVESDPVAADRATSRSISASAAETVIIDVDNEATAGSSISAADDTQDDWSCAFCSFVNHSDANVVSSRGVLCDCCGIRVDYALTVAQRQTRYPSLRDLVAQVGFGRRLVWDESSSIPLEHWLSTVRPSRLSRYDCDWIQVHNIRRNSPGFSDQSRFGFPVDPAPYQVHLRRLEDLIARGRRISAATKKECVEAMKQIAHQQGVTTGKWMLWFYPSSPEKADRHWKNIACATVQGRLGCSAKICPLLDMTERAALCCVYVQDFDDLPEVERVLRVLKLEMGFYVEAGFKPDFYTDLGIDSNTKKKWRLEPTIYKVSDFIQGNDDD